MHIKKANPSDIDKIMPLVYDAVMFMNAHANYQWDEDYPNQSVFENDIHKGHLFVVRDQKIISGLIVLNEDQPDAYQPLSWQTPPQALIIHRMIVSANYRGKGVARKLFEFAEEEAIRQGFTAIRSDTNIQNKAMNYLFKVYNYRYTGQITLRNNPDLFNCYEKFLS